VLFNFHNFSAGNDSL